MRKRIRKILYEMINQDIVNPLEVLVIVQNTEYQKLITHQISNLVSLADASYLGINEQRTEGAFTIFARFANESTKNKFLKSLSSWMDRKHPEIKYECRTFTRQGSTILENDSL